MKNKTVIALVGMPGSGKSITAKYFQDKNIPILRFGEQTDIGLKELNKELSEENERWYREKLRNELGMGAYAIKIEPKIKKVLETIDVVVLDGLYSWEEYIYLKKQFPNLVLLCIFASPKIRYNRLSQRTIRSLTLEDAISRDHAELAKLNKGGPIAIADYTIINEENIESLHKNLDQFLHQIYKN
ncbi:AAA family ATPase [Candidatus Gottesmanbacteria bacterium]|nr:AAA family ATPase [Candidatus Gottesmanbacteria bacterium]